MKPLFWHRCEATSDSPASREGHSLTYSSAYDCYLLYGGIGSQRFKEVHAFSTTTKSWEEITTSGKPPPERNGHIAWIDDENHVMYVHGGQSTKREAMADLYALQLNSGSWSRVTLAEEQPEERTHHAVAKIANHAFVFGGSSPVTPFMRDLWSFNFGALDWSQGRISGQGWTKHAIRGQGPPPRKAHSMVSFDGKLYIFGGITEQGYVNDMYAINTKDFKVYKVNAKGAVPSPRAYHSVTVMENGFMAMFGGLESLWDGKTEKLNLLGDFYILNLHDMRWSLQTLPPGGTVPTRRYGHAMEWGYCGEIGQIVLLGGIDRTHCAMDVYWLEETHLAPGQAWQIQELESREKASAIQTENTITLQRNKLQEMEQQLYISNQRISGLEAEKQRINELLGQEKRSTKDESRRLAKKIDFLERANKHRRDRIVRLQEMDRMNKEKTDVLQRRSEELEDIVKKAESLLITLDHSFNELISLNMHPHFKPLSKEKLDEMADRKKKHQDCLVDLRTTYEDQNKQLEVLDTEMDSLTTTVKRLEEEDHFDKEEDMLESQEDSELG